MQGLVAGLILSDRFELIRQLGVGGMGEIWLADDQQLKEQIAIKILSPTLRDAEGFVDLMRDECRKARGLVHPNIVRVFDFHADGSLFFISMQYVDGETLVSYRGQPFQKIIHCLLMICDALEYAHRTGIVHRDLKTANVLIDQNGDCYLTDFGISAALAGKHRHSEPRGGGSLPSMSPQQLANEPAAVSDDIYSFGSLCYELLSGQPLFHPGVTAERIRVEQPKTLLSDGANQQIPDMLRKLVMAMLNKDAERRPAGVRAVRLVLEEVLADNPKTGEQANDAADANAGADLIQPVRRASVAARRTPDKDKLGRPDRAVAVKKGLSPSFVYAALAVLILVALSVIFFLPSVIEERGPVVIERNNSAEDTPVQVDGNSDPAASEAQRKIADEALGELLEIDDRLRSIGVDLWGGSDWSEARRTLEAGDTAYRGRDFSTAAQSYRRATTLMELMAPRAAEALSAALREGQAAFDMGDQAGAVKNFELALAIETDNSIARKYLERAGKLDQIVELMNRAATLVDSDDLDGAGLIYQQVLTLDSLWQPARESLARISSGIARTEYETQMAKGFGAMAQENLSRARAAFAAALAVRPGDPEATSALRQLDVEAQLLEIATLQGEARLDEQRENWAAAVQKYETILGMNAQLSETQSDLTRTRQRLDLHGKLTYEISHPERLNEDKVWNSANQLLGRARSTSPSGPVLAAQTGELAELLKIASIPVPVEFRSDNLTEVVIYKVGNLGTFMNRTVDLKPGAYVAVGTREGYRDVRRSFTVTSTGGMGSIDLSCKDAI
jgi:serine/threonine protein kinase/tetratricopeptide (TPR) repeat protein